MEKMPYQPDLDSEPMVPPTATTVVETDWRNGLPVLTGLQITLRELRPTDAQSLFAMLTTEEVARFISPPPTTVEGFERFIAWTIRQRAAGTYVCFAVTLQGFDTAIGIFQVRQTEPGFGTAEWGFALGSAFWGTGVFLKMGAVQEGVLRKSFLRNGRYLDQVLYAILEDDWRAARDVSWPTHHALVH